MTETLPPCPREDCDADPAWAGHHWHDWRAEIVQTACTADVRGHWVALECFGSDAQTCGEPGASGMTRCYSAHIPEPDDEPADRTTYRDAETGQYVTAEHAAAHPATTVREDDSRVREMQRRLDAVVALADRWAAEAARSADAQGESPREPDWSDGHYTGSRKARAACAQELRAALGVE